MRIRIRHTVLLLAIALLTVPQVIHAQWFGSKSDMINTLRVIVNGDWEQPAIIRLNSDDRIEFSFDEMSHQYHRFTYHIQSEPGVDIRKPLFFMLSERGWPILGLEAVGMSLEDVFIKLMDTDAKKKNARGARGDRTQRGA